MSDKQTTTSVTPTTKNAIVRHCPFQVNVNKDFLYGGVFVAVLGTGYWFLRCRGRNCRM